MTHATLRVDNPSLARRGLDVGDDAFLGLPEGATRLELFILVRDVGRSLGLTTGDIAHLEYLLRFTREGDWEPGTVGPVVYKSVSGMAAELGLSERQVHRREKKLFGLGFLRWRDSGNRRRYGKRDGEGRLLFAYGADLSPLAEHFDELVRLKAQHHQRLEAFAAAKRRYSRLRQQIHVRLLEAFERGVDVEDVSAAHKALPRLAASMRSEEAATVVETAQGLVERLDAALAACSPANETDAAGRPVEAPVDNPTHEPPSARGDMYMKPQKVRPVGRFGPTHRTTRELPLSIESTGNRPVHNDGKSVAERGPSGGGRDEPPRLLLDGRNHGAPDCGARHISLRQAVATAGGGFLEHLWPVGPVVTIADLVEAADARRREIEVHASAWHEARRIMGDYGAALAVIVIDRNLDHPETPIRSPGGVLRAMSDRAKVGALYLHRSVYGILERDGRREALA